jgi:hypothetical protein
MSANGKRPRRERWGFAISKQTMDDLMKDSTSRAGDAIALLAFYNYTALWQDTNQPRATVEYVAKGLHWGLEKVRQIKGDLRALGYIEDIQQRDPKTNRVVGTYVRLKYFHPTEKPKGGEPVHPQDFSTPGKKPECGPSQTVETKEANALKSDKGNACTPDKGNACTTPRAPREGVYAQSHAESLSRSAGGRGKAKKRVRGLELQSERDRYGYAAEIIDFYNERCAEFGLWPVDRYSETLHRFLWNWLDQSEAHETDEEGWEHAFIEMLKEERIDGEDTLLKVLRNRGHTQHRDDI